MQVSLLGAGAIAYGAAAYLSQAGHDPMLWSPSGKRTAELAAGKPLTATNAIELTFSPRIANSCKDAVDNADVLMIVLPGYGHKFVLDAAAPHIRNGQSVIISSHMSFSALYLSKLLAARGVRATIIAWGTTLTTGRQLSPTEVQVATVRQRLDLATVPQSAAEEGHALCTTLFGDRFVIRDGLLAIALSNLNPQNHLGIAMLNLTRMERGEQWDQSENVTPAVGRLIEALDVERLAIAASFGLSVRTVQEHFSLSFHVPMGGVAEMNAAMFAQGHRGNGPATLDTRYVLEDMPFGILPTILVGRLAGKPAALHESGVAVMSAAFGRDFEKDNDLLPELNLNELSIAQLQQLARNGYGAV